MKITTDHWIDTAQRDALPGGAPMPVRRFLVIHFTGGWTAASSIAFWRTPAARGASAHILIDRDGSILQCRPFNRTAGHAGKSKWRDPQTGLMHQDLNSCSIGIELANCGDLQRQSYPAALGRGPIKRLRARHKHGGEVTLWEMYDQRQMDTLLDMSRALVTRYKLDDVVGHDDIAPARKNDPGPAFDMPAFRTCLGFPR